MNPLKGNVAMHLDQNPVFRKMIVPWYDSNPVCCLTMIFMLAVILWGSIGISVCQKIPTYHKYLWLPLLLVILGSGVLLSIGIRMIKRCFR